MSQPLGSTTSATEAASTFASILQNAEDPSGQTRLIPLPRAQNTTSRSRKLRAVADWDPSYDSEQVDWFSEYKARWAPLSMSWFAKPIDGNEVRGIAYFEEQGRRKAVGPLEDGTVCIWDVDSREHSQSSPGALFAGSSPYPYLSDGTECITVDVGGRKALIAVGSVLKTVDLTTLTVVSERAFTSPIMALSQNTSEVDHLPVLGTRDSIHVHDPRKPPNGPTSASLNLMHSRTIIAADMCPLSIMDVGEHSLYVAGRHPSIVRYDRRSVPRIEDTIHSGARLCSLGLSSLMPTASSTSANPINNLLACGEYNGRGSLEVYSLSHDDFNPSNADSKPLPPWKTYQNRQSASRAKLLSVAAHGTRIFFTDADGGLKWVERDGKSLVRSWNINEFSCVETKGRPRQLNRTTFEFRTQGDDAARKVIAIPAGESERGARGDGELLTWTGDKAGTLQFREKEDWHDAKEKVEEAQHEAERQSGEQRRYEEVMRNALMRQTDEINRMRRFGLV